MVSVYVAADSLDPGVIAAARQMAQRLCLSFVERHIANGDELLLTLTDRRLELRDRESRRKGVFAELESLDPGTRAGRGVRSQPLRKAIGPPPRTVIDATAGLGHDSALLATLGYQVTAVERSPVIAALLEDGVRRAQSNDEMGKCLSTINVLAADSRTFLSSLIEQPDVVYIDPMFPPKRKASALAKKSIRMVRAIVGDDPDATELLSIARSRVRDRVVVKRPTYAAPLAPHPAMTYEGTLVRYDVYRPLPASVSGLHRLPGNIEPAR